jgi:hypothetical protein
MQLQVGKNQHVTLRGNNLERHEKLALTAYRAAKSRYKIKPEDKVSMHLVDDDNGLNITVTVNNKEFKAEHQEQGWHWEKAADSVAVPPYLKPATGEGQPGGEEGADEPENNPDDDDNEPDQNPGGEETKENNPEGGEENVNS